MRWDEALERVRSVAQLCADEGLLRVRLEEPEFSVEVRRTRARRVALEPLAASSGESETPLNGRHHNGVAEARVARTLRAEFVGIVRFARPAIAPGTVLGEDRELAYVEALGIRNSVRSGPGRVADVFVSDGQAVDFGQALFAVEN